MKRLGTNSNKLSIIMEGNKAKVLKGNKLMEVVQFEKGDNLLETVDTLKKQYLLESMDDIGTETQWLEYVVLGPKGTKKMKDYLRQLGIPIEDESKKSYSVRYRGNFDQISIDTDYETHVEVLKYIYPGIKSDEIEFILTPRSGYNPKVKTIMAMYAENHQYLR